ncbi:MAG: ABC transporter substrate-binding protein [Gaiellaceae bacterium]
MTLLAVAASLLLVGYGAASGKKGSASKTFVFASSADPVLLDPALVSDGESLRITNQIFQSLVGFKLGGSQVVPQLATSWKASKNALAWTFMLRKGVKFSDGTAFNAAAVCYNYNRWYNFPAALQNPAVSYYWNTVFGGFAHPAKGNPGPSKSLYKGCKTKGAYQVTLLLRRRSSSFVSAIGLPNFGIASPTALKKYKANAGTTDSTGVFHPAGTFATKHPVGTGPYMLKSWEPNVKLVVVANPKYSGPKPAIKTVIYRPIPDSTARLQALQTGEIQGMDYVAPADYSTVQKDSKLQLLKRPVSSVGYIGLNQAKPPMNNLLVREAVAYAIDKKTIIHAIYGQTGQVANQFLPPSLFGFAKSGVPSYSLNPAKSKALLQQAGLKLPVKIDFWYPTNVVRSYMPDPARIFQAMEANLNEAGFSVQAHSAPWRPDYLGGAQSGQYQMYLLGWIADYYDPQDFLNVHFGSKTPLFGFNNPSLFKELANADAEPNAAVRTKDYVRASINVMKFLPVVPYAWGSSALALDKNIKGYTPGPIGPINEPWANLHYAK